MRLGFLRPPFLEQSTPPPFYQSKLGDKQRRQLDSWFIGTRSQAYYLKRFDEMDKAGKLIARWNWAAFAMTFGWLLCRKRYLDCFVYCVAGWSFIKLTIAISLALLEFFVIRHLAVDIQWGVRIAWAAMVWLYWASMVASWADAYYYRMARREIADALDLYPNNPAAQQAHLRQHGGTSWLGLSLALAIFTAMLLVVAVQFMPLVAASKEQTIIYHAYQSLSGARLRVEHIYHQSGCPVGLPLSSDRQNFSLTVVDKVVGVQSDCAIVLTVTKAGYPVRYLNGQTIVFYRTDDNGIWRCQSSLNQQKIPKQCVS